MERTIHCSFFFFTLTAAIMKSLLLVRHAKSSWENFSLPDFDRPLNERGKHDAPMMARRLQEMGIQPDALVSSPAKRARKTAQAFADVLDIPKKNLILQDELYMASPESFHQVVSRLNDDCNVVALFSHNPGISDYANQLDAVTIDEMPTCGILAVTAPVNSWSAFRQAKKAFWFFDYPKNTQPPGAKNAAQ
jgi:phosphohistidine phosphatase